MPAVLMSSFSVYLLFGTVKLVSGLLDENSNHQDKDDQIEEQDSKDGPQEGTKEDCRVGYEAAGEKHDNTSHSGMSATIVIL